VWRGPRIGPGVLCDEGLGPGGICGTAPRARRTRIRSRRLDGGWRKRLAGAPRDNRVSDPAPNRSLERPAAVARWVRRGSSQQLLVDGCFAFSLLELHATALPGATRAGFAQPTLSFLCAPVAGGPADWLVVDRWICRGLGVAANAVGKHTLVLLTVFVLFDAVSGGFFA
jgi:hypothetical protein